MKVRLPNSFGGVTKLSGNRRRPYVVRVTESIDSETGKQKFKVLGYFAKYTEAMSFLVAYNENKNNGDVKLPPKDFQSLYESLTDDKYIKQDKSIPYSYSCAYKRCKDLYNKNINDIKLSDLNKIMDSAPTIATKRDVKILLSQMYKYAMKHEYIDKNLAERLDSYTQKESQMHRPFTEEEIKLLWNKANEFPAIIWLIYIYTGLRPSELLNILTEDVHLKEQYMIGGMKNQISRRRMIPIADCIKPFIEKMYDPNRMYLITDDDGNQISYKDMLEILTEFCISNNIQHLPHDARHTCATFLDTIGTNLIVTQRILGHSSKTITGKVYIHKNLEEMLQAVNNLPTYQ